MAHARFGERAPVARYTIRCRRDFRRAAEQRNPFVPQFDQVVGQFIRALFVIAVHDIRLDIGDAAIQQHERQLVPAQKID